MMNKGGQLINVAGTGGLGQLGRSRKSPRLRVWVEDGMLIPPQEH
jgi:hypothetical protein